MTTSIKQNLIPNEPELKDLLNLHQKNILLNFCSHHVATVQSFDAETQTATATINYTKTFLRPNAQGVYGPVQVDYPVLTDAPVMFLGGGDGALTFPVAQGDECLVLFNDRDLDNWFQGSSGAAVATSRLHSFSDAIILVGLRSLPNVLTSFSDDAIELRTKSGNAKVAVKADGSNVKVTAPTITLEINSAGKLKVTNDTGEFVAALIAALQGATAGGFPLVIDLTTLLTFKA